MRFILLISLLLGSYLVAGDCLMNCKMEICKGTYAECHANYKKCFKENCMKIKPEVEEEKEFLKVKGWPWMN